MMTTTLPLVSVIVAYCNEERFICDAIQSVGAQAHRPIELILVDDGSTDRGALLARQTVIPDVTLLHRSHPTKRGVSAARNTGLIAATGDYITYLDGDDLCSPSRLVQMMAVMQSDPDVDVLMGQDELLVEPGCAIPEEVSGGRDATGRRYYFPSMLYRRAVHDVVGGFDTRFEVCEDIDWIHRARAAGLRIDVCDILAVIRRIHGSNASYRTEMFRHYRLKSLYELTLRRRHGVEHYVDPSVGAPGQR